MGSRLVNGIIYSENQGVIVNNNSVSRRICTYKLKYKHSVLGYICKTSCGCTNMHYTGELLCSYCGLPINFIGRNGKPHKF